MDDLTEDQIANLRKLADQSDKLLSMSDDYEKSKWLGRLLWKVGMAIGATIAAFAAFKAHVLSLLGKG